MLKALLSPRAPGSICLGSGIASHHALSSGNFAGAGIRLVSTTASLQYAHQSRKGSKETPKKSTGGRNRRPLEGPEENADPASNQKTRPRRSVEWRFNNLRTVRLQERVRSWAGTVAVTDPGSVTEQDLIQQLPDGDVDFTVTTAVVLFTPGVARFHTEGFIQKILTHLCRAYLQTPSKQTLIRVVTGIVDKVPGSTENRRPQSPVSEGVSVMLSNSFMDQALHEADASSASSNQQPSILRFGSIINRIDHPSDVGGGEHVKGTHELHLAMANTLFVNGRHSTLAESFWGREGDGASSGSSRPLQLVQGFRYLKDFTVHTEVPSGAIFGSIVPLKAVTKPRRIRRAMGNIIREIEVDGAAVPAASELEKSVSDFAKEHGDRATIGGKVLVFALVRDAEANPILHSMRPIATSAKFKTWLDGGARLLRVTGGGGGWGQKKGLLSLEPSTGFGDYDGDGNPGGSNVGSADDASADADADADDSPPPVMMGKTPNLVQPGAIVQFFICVAELGNAPATPRQNSRGLGTKKNAHGYERDFTHALVAGMVPQAESAVSEAEAAAAAAAAAAAQGSDGVSPKEQARLVKDTFGALTEQGLGLVIKQYGQRRADSEPTVTPGGRRRSERILSTTRFDLPHVRFEYKVHRLRKMAPGLPQQEKTADADKSA